jgi:uncharacterized membrane protein YjjP (DUF1212 family)
MEKLVRKFDALLERPYRVQFLVLLVILMTSVNFVLIFVLGSWINFIAFVAGVYLLWDYLHNIDKDEKDYNKYHG